MTQHVHGTTRLAGLVALLAAEAGSTSARIKYVTSGSDPVEVAAFLSAVLTGPFNLAVLDADGVGVTVTDAAYLRFRPLPNDVRALRRTVTSYGSLPPWLLRLAVGLPLVDAGFSGYFFSLAVQFSSPVFIRLFGITIRLLLLFGFGTRPIAAIDLGTYLVELAVEPALILAFEYVPGFLAITLADGGRPSADHVVASMAADDRTFYSRIDPFYRRVALPFIERTRHLEAYVLAVLRVGLGLTLVYLGVVQKLIESGDMFAIVAKYNLTAVTPVAPELWVVGAGLTETLAGVLLAGSVFTRTASGVAFLPFTTTLFGLPGNPVLAHISLFGLVSTLLVADSGPLSVNRAFSSHGAGDTESDGDTSGRSVGAWRNSVELPRRLSAYGNMRVRRYRIATGS